MPLIPGHIGNLDEEPLAGDVLEAWFDNPQLHSACENGPPVNTYSRLEMNNVPLGWTRTFERRVALLALISLHTRSPK